MPESSSPSVASAVSELRERNVSAALASDVLDALGVRNRVMNPRVRHLSGVTPTIGRAATVEVVSSPGIPDDPDDHYRLHIAAIDSLRHDSVIVFSTAAACLWGELFSVAAAARGCVGAVVDGYVRDIDGIERLAFPTFACGCHPADALGRADVRSVGGDIVSGGIDVAPGDVIVADRDGIVVIPAECLADVASRASEKRTAELNVHEHLENGASLAEVFKQFGVL